MAIKPVGGAGCDEKFENLNILEAIQASEVRIRADLAGVRSDIGRFVSCCAFVEPQLATNGWSTAVPEQAIAAALNGSHGSEKIDASLCVDGIRAVATTNVVTRACTPNGDQGIGSLNGREPLHVDFQSSGSGRKVVGVSSSQSELQGGRASPAGAHLTNWLQIRKEWLGMADHQQGVELENALPGNVAGSSFKLAVPSTILDKNHKRRWRYICCAKAFFRPESALRLGFELLSIGVLMFDLVYMPFSLSWESVIPYDIAAPIALFSSLFWSLDMCFSFCTGYHTVDGNAEMRMQKIAKRYVRTWFILDFSCLVGDMVYVVPLVFFSDAIDSKASLSKLLRMAKLARFLHLIGVVRMLRVMNILSKFMEAQLSEGWRMMVRIGEMTTCLVWLGHVCACGWFGLGKIPRGAEEADIEDTNWLDSPVGLRGDLVRDTSWWYQYVTSYHWALAQITLGAHDINPVNTFERVFTIWCNLFGILLGGTLIAILSNTLIYLKELNQERATKMRVLKEFLLQHDVDIGVRMRVLNQVQDRVIQREHVLVENDVPALEVLSRGVLRDLRCDLFQPPAKTHMVFRAWTCFSDACLETLCETGVEFAVLLKDDELFKTGIPSAAGYHVSRGMMMYTVGSAGATSARHQTKSNTKVLDTDVPGSIVEAGSWLCEATWWCHWHHVGTAVSITEPCTFLSIEPQVVARAAHQDMAVALITSEYAKLFHQRLVEAGRGNLPNDLRVPSADFSDLIFSMPEDVRIVLGLAALRQVLEAAVSTKLEASLLELETEIREGRCVVLLDKNGNLQRQVALALLRIEYESKVLVQVGQFDISKQEWNVNCKLPGIKQKLGEPPRATMKRFVKERVAVFKEESDWKHFGTRQESSESSQYGIGTTYTKNTFTHECSSDLYQRLQNYRHILRVPSQDDLGASDNDIGSSSRLRTVSGMNIGKTKTEEVRVEVMSSITEVYILYGTDALGMYVWMEEENIEPLSSDQQQLENWVAKLGGIQSQFEDIGKLMAVEEGESEEVKVEEPVHTYTEVIAGTTHYYQTI